MCSGFMIAHKGHQAMLSAAVWLPLILFCFERYARRRMSHDLCLAAVALALSILAGFPQVTVYSMLVAAPYLVVRMSQLPGRSVLRNAARAVPMLAAITVLGCALSSLQIFAVAEALPEMTRATLPYAMFNEDSLPIYRFAAFFIPNIWGGLYRTPSFSPDINVVEVYPYMGLLPLALSLLAFQGLRRTPRVVWFWFATAVVTLILSFGLIPIQFLLYRVPIYNLFRAPCRHLLEVDFSICVLAASGWNSLFCGSRAADVARRVPWRTAALFAAALAISFSFAGLLRHFAVVASSPEFRRRHDLHVNPMMSFSEAERIILFNLRIGHPTILISHNFWSRNSCSINTVRRPEAAADVESSGAVVLPGRRMERLSFRSMTLPILGHYIIRELDRKSQVS